jgi:hypothetical protein
MLATAPDSNASQVQEIKQTLNAKCEMLYRRARLMLPNNGQQFILGSILLFAVSN